MDHKKKILTTIQKIFRIVLVGGAAYALFGCASAFMSGSEPAKTPPANPKATFVVKSCTLITDGSTVNIPGGITYYLDEDSAGTSLYEFDSAGRGAKFTNNFSDSEGLHFINYVKTSHGYEIIVPQSAGQQGKRLVYIKGSFKAYDDAGIMKFRGAPGYDCPFE